MSTTRFLIAFLFLLGAGLQAQIVQRSHVVSGGAVNATGGSYAMRGTIGQPVIGITGTTTQAKQGFWYTVGTGSALNLVEADVKVFLQGPYAAGTMSTALKTAGYIPLAQPYNVAPWSYGGSEAVGAIPANVVDWVLVELRTGNPAAPPMTVAARRAAFLLSNGKIVDLNGSSILQFTGAPPGSYYVVVRHRNHLSVMSAGAIDFSAGQAAYDFTTSQSQAYGTTSMNQVGTAPDVFAMVMGDVSANGQVKYSGPGNDRLPIFNAVGNISSGTASGYHAADVNMNGQVKYSGPGNDRLLVFNAVGNLSSGTRSTNVPTP